MFWDVYLDCEFFLGRDLCLLHNKVVFTEFDQIVNDDIKLVNYILNSNFDADDLDQNVLESFSQTEFYRKIHALSP